MKMKMVRNREKGFTLIELLVVIVLLGALAAIAVPNVARFTSSGVVEAAKTELGSVQTAIDVAMTELKLTAADFNTWTGVDDFSLAGGDPIIGTDAGGDAVYLYPNYIRFATSGGDTTTYSLDATTAVVTQGGAW